MNLADPIWLGAGLLAGGFLLALLSGAIQVLQGEASTPLRPAILALVLIAFILLYDAKMKRTWLGPFYMGGCRFLNVLLGASAAGAAAHAASRMCVSACSPSAYPNTFSRRAGA